MTATPLRNLIALSGLKQFPSPQTFYVRRSFLPMGRDCYWQINSGVVRTYSWLDDGSIVVYGLWGEGDIISPLLAKSDLQMECMTDVKVSSLSLDRLIEVNQALINQTKELQELINIKQYRPVNTALIKLLKWLSNKFGHRTHNGILIDLRLTHQQIAETLGTTRVTVTRLLTIFEHQGKIDRTSNGKIIIKNN
ncbi:Crp/Fnr family transcriptional regulator [Geminocystis sp. GBBB08]|uniref:Crp/Fnr family transcriptional regulator n=1 Tax=Geminocystis sp. GBBB08 TaxID=2604140 RepID=UPI0027E32A8A|nr:Crp/Fnr family transcriptional regulator [Geminocystis sp. GBBB08]MBL1208946.1 Crp/Fnr family transcriptional regulator [Geminocystis sp. GBBB08]